MIRFDWGVFSDKTSSNDIDSFRLRKDVRELYEKHLDKICLTSGKMILTIRNGDVYCSAYEDDDYDGERRFYVYEWYTKDKGKIFYVGKGTGKRYKHIYDDMKDSNRKEQYQELQDNFGIDCRIVADNMTNLEAMIYEKCWIRERTEQGEVLLQFADMPLEAENEKCEMLWTRNFTPYIEINDYKRRYFDVAETVDYDAVELEPLLCTNFLSSRWDNYANHEKEIIMDYIESRSGRVYTTLAKSAKSVIELCILDYDRYKNLKEKGYLVYHARHILNFIKTTAPAISEGVKIKVPKFDSTRRDVMRAYIKNNNDVINNIIEKITDNWQLEMTGLFFANRNYEEAIKYLEACVRTKIPSSSPYLQLAVIYRNYGMLEEELNTLKLGISNVEQNNNHLYELKERLNKVQLLINQPGTKG